METRKTGQITQLLVAAGQGDGAAHERLWAAIYDELHGLAQRHMANEAPGHTLQPTALIHEAYLRLFGGDRVTFANRAHFFAAAGNVMRRILIDDARKRNRLKRGGGRKPGPIHEVAASFDEDPAKLIALDEALDGLAKHQPRKAEVVELRFFAGLTEEEIADALGLCRRTVQIEWSSARAWMRRELTRGDRIPRS